MKKIWIFLMILILIINFFIYVSAPTNGEIKSNPNRGTTSVFYNEFNQNPKVTLEYLGDYFGSPTASTYLMNLTEEIILDKEDFIATFDVDFHDIIQTDVGNYMKFLLFPSDNYDRYIGIYVCTSRGYGDCHHDTSYGYADIKGYTDSSTSDSTISDNVIFEKPYKFTIKK